MSSSAKHSPICQTSNVNPFSKLPVIYSQVKFSKKLKTKFSTKKLIKIFKKIYKNLQKKFTKIHKELQKQNLSRNRLEKSEFIKLKQFDWSIFLRMMALLVCAIIGLDKFK